MRSKHMIDRFGNNDVDHCINTDSYGEEYLQSYNTIIANKLRDGRVYIDENHWKMYDAMINTGYYRNYLLGETAIKTREKIESGEYKLLDLNTDWFNFAKKYQI